MRILLTGATGLIGSAAFARLKEAGHEVIAVVRRLDAAARRLPADRFLVLDVAKATKPEHWLPHLHGVDAIINCAGVLQDSARDSTAGVHVGGATALFAACEQTGVRRVVHLSAIGVDRETPTTFSRSKVKGDED